ncbi:undecaprenyl phosphate translocase family protein, partial [Psychrobacter urativorans]|uniref:undecaprenyl phosphate translocase family protein n=1 Tax=Psychrobacter urativorans TaxID=45610 RepID=UPI003BB67EF7
MTALKSPQQDDSLVEPSTVTSTKSSSLSHEPAPSSKDGPKQLLAIYVKGMTMGAADVVPGVSGGTIALIAGIYERLINAISSIGPHLWSVFRLQGGVKGLLAVWRQVDATFLLFLLLGIGTSIVTLAGIIKGLLEHQPLLIWSWLF